ncbi:hypothetical protein CBR_g29550 [Chara braunii]|uniref:Phosphatidic acid phosphatase type 2/haloperoxidase domain-containing protein n=1 Tax=Chara braunii TaxID=69332 RepID=A0A388LB39_CHABU|nr:hypothetical protein CBR_g29550 [Chara braunii]|eukprot:GBG79402.1 hypothetical protein CBR_g29550 [Chara braunii]
MGQISVLQRLAILDAELSARLYCPNEGFVRMILQLLEHSGHGLLWIPLSLAVWLTPLADFPPGVQTLFLNFFVGFIVDIAIVGAIKWMVARPRPSYNSGMTLVVSVDKYSFPSGHASRAILIAVLCSACGMKGVEVGPDVKSLGCAVSIRRHVAQLGIATWHLVFVWIWACSTAMSRVFLGRHYPVDVIVGCFVGAFEAYILLHHLWVPDRVAEGLRIWLLTRVCGLPK